MLKSIALDKAIVPREGGGQRFPSHAAEARKTGKSPVHPAHDRPPTGGPTSEEGRGGMTPGPSPGQTSGYKPRTTPVSRKELAHVDRHGGRYGIKRGQGYSALARKLGYNNYKELRTAMRADGVKMLHANKDYSKYKKGGQWYAGNMGGAATAAAAFDPSKAKGYEKVGGTWYHEKGDKVGSAKELKYRQVAQAPVGPAATPEGSKFTGDAYRTKLAQQVRDRAKRSMARDTGVKPR